MRTEFLGWVRLQWDRVAAWGCVAGGMVTLFVGWFCVSGTPYTARQLPYIAGCGLGGLFLLGLGAMLWLSADLRDEWRKLDRIEKAINRSGVAPPVASTAVSFEATQNRHGGRATVAVGRS